MNRVQIIQAIINKINAQRYLEIGVQAGATFNQIKCKSKIGIDPLPRPSSLKSGDIYFQLTSDEYFKREVINAIDYPASILKIFDVIFIDGLHHYEQVVKDIKNSLLSLKEGGIIILHDCNPTKEEWQRREPAVAEWTGDVWKTMVWAKYNLEYECFTFDCDYGIGIINTQLKLVPPTIKPNHESMLYSYFDSRRTKLLNLVPSKRFTEWLPTLHVL